MDSFKEFIYEKIFYEVIDNLLKGSNAPKCKIQRKPIKCK
jgi:hypothetical protein